MKDLTKSQAWREVKFSRRFRHAFRGVYVLWKTTRHIYVYLLAVILVISSGFYFNVSSTEWIALVFAMGLVIISETFNTAIEIDIDLTSPEFHPYARDTKDVAAAAVLFSSMISVIIAAFIFIPKLYLLN